jgi:spore coat polysaccharide biosynthesis protein SpsF
MVVAIIQARMGSSRLPGKVLKIINGRPMMWYLLDRLHHSRRIEKIVVATTIAPADQAIVDFCTNSDIEVFRGDENDVLDRYYKAASKYNADPVVRITADCPLIDPELVDMVITHYIDGKGKFDFVHNGLSYPDGIVETEIFSFAALSRAWENARLASEREHVTAYIWKNKKIFNIATIEYERDLSKMRLTVDNENDFIIISEIIKNLYSEKGVFSLKDILKFLEGRGDLLDLNRDTVRNEGYLKSLEQEKK